MLPRRTLLLEEGSVAREVVIVLRGAVDIYRRVDTSNDKPVRIEEQKIPLDYTKSALTDENDEEGYLAELAKGFFRLKPKTPV